MIWKNSSRSLFLDVHARNTANIKNRQPIGTMYVKADKEMGEFYTDIIADELNVKEVKFARRCRILYFLQLQAAASYSRTKIR